MIGNVFPLFAFDNNGYFKKIFCKQFVLTDDEGKVHVVIEKDDSGGYIMAAGKNNDLVVISGSIEVPGQKTSGTVMVTHSTRLTTIYIDDKGMGNIKSQDKPKEEAQ